MRSGKNRILHPSIKITNNDPARHDQATGLDINLGSATKQSRPKPVRADPKNNSFFIQSCEKKCVRSLN